MSIFEGFRFRKVSSVVHLLDPRVKFFFVCVLFVIAIVYSELLPLVLLFFVPLPLVFVAGVQREWLRSLRGAALFAILIFGANIFFGYIFPSGVLKNELPIDTLSEYLILLDRSLALTLRFVVLVETFSVFFLTTSPDLLGLALEQSRVPYEFVFAFTTAVRFVPVLADEAQTIMDAQKARGLELERGNFLKRVRNYIPILIPLIVSAIRRSLDLAEAMESRAWGASEKRTNLYVLKMGRLDYTLLLVSIAILVFAVYLRLFFPVPSITTLVRT